MLRPYRKAAKLSLNRARLSWSSCTCIRLASRSAIPSENSAKAGSSSSSGRGSASRSSSGLSPWTRRRRALAESRRDEREMGRRGVVGREGGLRERDAERRCSEMEPVGVVEAIGPVEAEDGGDAATVVGGWWCC
jgi:hypothetical protein